MTGAAFLTVSASTLPLPPVLVRPRPVLPPGHYDKVMPWTLPATRDVLRGDFWAVPHARLPPVLGGPAGGSSEHPDRIITGLDYKYDRSLWPGMINEHRRRRFTHWLRWWPNARDDTWFNPYAGSIAAFVDDCGSLKRLGMPYVIVSLGSKVFDPRDQSVQQWQDRVGPVLEALLSADVVDELMPALEWNLFNVPGPTTIAYFKWLGQQAHAAGVSLWAHFSPHVTGWWDDDRGRYGFWDDLGNDVDGLMYQSQGLNWDVPMLQARIVDTLSQFGLQGNVHKFRLCEDLASDQFSGQPTGSDYPNENDGAMRGLLACCTIDNVFHTNAKVWGYGGSGVNFDGHPL